MERPRELEENPLELTCSKHEVKNFLSSNLWKDMQREYDLWREIIRSALELSKDDDERNRGKIETILYAKALPEVILFDLEEKEKNDDR